MSEYDEEDISIDDQPAVELDQLLVRRAEVFDSE